MRPPAILEKFGLIQPDRFWKPNKALSGLISAPKKWGEERNRSLTGKKVMPRDEIGNIQCTEVAEVKQCTSCKSLWSVLLNNKPIGYFLIYVDDVLMVADTQWVQGIIEMFGEIWECKVTGILARKETGKDSPVPKGHVDKINFLGVTVEDKDG